MNPPPGRVLVAVAGQLDRPGCFALWPPGADRPQLHQLPHAHRRDGRGPGLVNAVRYAVGKMFDDLTEIRVVLESVPRVRRVPGLVTLLTDPRVVVSRVSRRNVIEHTGMNTASPLDESIFIATVAKKLNPAPTSFWESWVAALALAGAARAWGSLSTPTLHTKQSDQRGGDSSRPRRRSTSPVVVPSAACILTVAEAAALLRVSAGRVRRMITEGHLTSFRTGPGPRAPLRIWRKDLESAARTSFNRTSRADEAALAEDEIEAIFAVRLKQ